MSDDASLITQQIPQQPTQYTLSIHAKIYDIFSEAFHSNTLGSNRKAVASLLEIMETEDTHIITSSRVNVLSFLVSIIIENKNSRELNNMCISAISTIIKTNPVEMYLTEVQGPIINKYFDAIDGDDQHRLIGILDTIRRST